MVYKFVSLDPESKSTPSNSKYNTCVFGMQLQDLSYEIDQQRTNCARDHQHYTPERFMQKFANEVDELREMPGHMLGAAQIQVPEYDLYDLKLTREEDGAVETLDPQFCMGSKLLEGLVP
ncbi:hypothetical protein Tco_1188757 [Tanacetum coccineum]|uniref:Uncharacterized protein n=1 Tax=Tanacetum coccineum TaxID=301880 RepID=A0ABQ5BL46_9ASTR